MDAIPASEQYPPSDVVPLVSVLMITWNHGPYLAAAIESIVGQKCEFPFEVIIGEDCSQDDTAALCEAYRQRYPTLIRIVTSDSNVGMHRNLARIWHRARGKYIAICEGDDYWCDAHKLAKQASFLEARPQYTMCGALTRCIVRREEADWSEAAIIGPPANKTCYTLDDLIPKYSFHTSSVMVRRSSVRFPRWFWEVYCADRPLYLLCAEQGPVGMIPEVMSVYRMHTAGVWATADVGGKGEKSEKLFHILDAHFEYRYHRLIQLTLSDIHWSYMAEAMNANQLATARKLFWKATRRMGVWACVRRIRLVSVAFIRLYVPGGYAWLKSLARQGGRA